MRVRLTSVQLTRHIQHEHSLDLKRSLFAFARGAYHPPQRRTVLDRISLELHSGERVGVVGPNGAGKSTLLKTIAGILPPSKGRIEVEGIVAPLIELGAGFDPDLSLYDNVVIYGVLLGFTRAAMIERMDGILTFAELKMYRSDLVKTLSSGMLARLGFAVASDIEPDVLLIDEVFSVGDEHFRHKSLERIRRLWSRGTASLIVSHDLQFIEETCDRVICMENGRIVFTGPPRLAIRFYRDVVEEV